MLYLIKGFPKWTEFLIFNSEIFFKDVHISYLLLRNTGTLLKTTTNLYARIALPTYLSYYQIAIKQRVVYESYSYYFQN